MRQRTTVTAVIVCVAVLAGCGQGTAERDADTAVGPPESATDGGHEPAVVWAEEYCSAALGLVEVVSRAPKVDPSSPERASETSMNMLAQVSGGLDELVAELDDLEPSPIPGGDEAADKAKDAFQELHDRSEVARERLDEVRRGEPGAEETRNALEVTTSVLDEVGEVNLLGGMERVPEFAEASRSAESCGEFMASGSKPSIDPGRD
ncbi:hypothetical protein [Haloechinothrix sp. LS1_15]|uniref:hypothetical protein n=1 Tax=Haloechinothrix sp. LS1_15 TaxID=2652248 RepID=UPI002945A355|nr:hypothetical protein [Haloechinothrix sp. LS1_15]MDV6011367.1 hypothetical protein [Haloechinothrix sp. LS1_15]